MIYDWYNQSIEALKRWHFRRPDLMLSQFGLHKKQTFVQKRFALFNNFLYLRPNWFEIRGQRRKIKRESGVTPGQSRCCEAL